MAVKNIVEFREQRCSSRTIRRHPFTVVSYQVAGELTMNHGGALTFRPGDLHVIPAGHGHCMTSARDVELWGVSIPTGMLDSERHASVLAPIERIAHGALPRITIPEERRSFVSSLFEELTRPGPTSTASVRQESLLVLLLTELSAHVLPSAVADERDERGARRQPDDLASRAIRFVTSHALGPLSLDDVARALKRNRAHVADVVRRATGCSVGELITEVRLDEARRRLEETDELVEVIGERVGYADATHFARMFKRRFDHTPRAWRERAAQQVTQRSTS